MGEDFWENVKQQRGICQMWCQSHPSLPSPAPAGGAPSNPRAPTSPPQLSFIPPPWVFWGEQSMSPSSPLLCPQQGMQGLGTAWPSERRAQRGTGSHLQEDRTGQPWAEEGMRPPSTVALLPRHTPTSSLQLPKSTVLELAWGSGSMGQRPTQSCTLPTDTGLLCAVPILSPGVCFDFCCGVGETAGGGPTAWCPQSPIKSRESKKESKLPIRVKIRGWRAQQVRCQKRVGWTPSSSLWNSQKHTASTACFKLKH